MANQKEKKQGPNVNANNRVLYAQALKVLLLSALSAKAIY